VGAGRRTIEGDEHAVLDLLWKVMLERTGKTIRFVPRVPEHVGEEPFDDPMTADGTNGGAPAFGGQLDAAIRTVIQKPALGEPLHGRGNRPGGDPEGFGERAGMSSGTALGEAVDGLQHLAIGPGQWVWRGFHGRESSF
jgi:hypothetical protein